MKISLKNIAKIENAEVTMDGITVIAGENNTGKSTLGKVIFSIYNSVHDYEEKIKNEKLNELINLLKSYLRDLTRKNLQGINVPRIALMRNFFEVSENYETSIKKRISDRIDNNELFDFSTLNEIVEEYNEFIHASYKKIENNVEISEQSDEVIEELNNIIELPADDIIKKMMTIQLNTEFGNQINNIYNIRKGEIIISDKQSNDFSLIIENNKISKISNYSSLDQFTVEYIDDPYVIDRLSDYSFRTLDIYFENHREALKNDLKKEMKPLLREMINEKNTENVLDFEQIDEAVNGRVFYDREKRKYVYKQPNKSETLNVENVSSGVKSLLILKTLLLNGSINKDSLLVLDEPEVHLHPEWQLLFSRLVISIQKKLGVKILVTTHSPYFLNAIEILSKKNEINTKYYLTEETDKDKYQVVDTSNDLERIYKKLAEPFQKLENMKYES